MDKEFDIDRLEKSAPTAGREADGMKPAMLVLLNVAAGAADSPDIQAMRGAFRDAGREPDIRTVTGDDLAGAALEFAAANRDSDGAVLAIGGGDGSIGTVAAALTGTRIALGILPLGTYNHFARDLGLPLDLAAAVAVVVAGRTRTIDLGEVNGRIFVNNSSIGFYPFLVSHRNAVQKRLRIGKLAATIPALWRAFRATGWRFLTVAAALNRAAVKTPCLFVGNNVYDIGKLGIRTHLDRGELGVCIVKRQSRLGMLLLPLLLLLHRIDRTRDIAAFTCTDALITSRKRHLRVALDGEVRKLTVPLRYRSLPGALRVCISGNAP